MIVQQETNTTFKLVCSRQNDVVYARIHNESIPISSQPYRLMSAKLEIGLIIFGRYADLRKNCLTVLVLVLQVHRKRILQGSTKPNFW